MLDEVFGGKLAKVRVVMELPCVEVVEDVVKLTVHCVDSVHTARVTRHGHEGVANRGAEPLGRVLNEVWSLIQRSCSHQLQGMDVMYMIQSVKCLAMIQGLPRQ